MGGALLLCMLHTGSYSNDCAVLRCMLDEHKLGGCLLLRLRRYHRPARRRWCRHGAKPEGLPLHQRT